MMADITAVLGRLTPSELNELRALGPQGHLSRQLTDALDRAAQAPNPPKAPKGAHGSKQSSGRGSAGASKSAAH